MNQTKVIGEFVREVTRIANWEIGGHENAILDGFETEMPSVEQLVIDVYYEVVETKHFKFIGEDQMKDIIKQVVLKVLAS